MNVLVGPVHLRDVHQAFDTGLDLDERPVIGQVGHLAEQTRSGRIAAGKPDPRILAQLLESQRNAVLLVVELEHLRREFVADGQHLGGMLDAAPRQIGDVQQSVDPAQIYECAVVGDVLDDALDHHAFLQRLEQLLPVLALGSLEYRAARHDHVVAFAVELDDLELHRLALIGRGVLDRTDIHQGARKECADTIGHDGQPALDLAADHAGDQGPRFQRFFKVQPRGQALGLVA